MKLNDYFAKPGSLSVSQLRERIGVKSDAQIRQWRHGYADRIPSAEYATAIEVATAGAVMRWDLRPHDWHRIWPELKRRKGAPRIATPA